MSSETFQEKLRRLRREASAPADPETPAVEPGLPIWLRQKLGSMHEGGGELSRAALAEAFGAGNVHVGPVAPDAGGLCPTTVGEPDSLAVSGGKHGPYAARATEFSHGHVHGTWRLNECAEVDSSLFALLSADGALAELDLTRAVFLDTETTGLSGGAGVYVYMIGLGWFEGSCFHLWQGFLREPSEERALLAEAARLIADADAVVSFFGKSFDRHRLEDKMRIVGIEPPFSARPHLDLYHPFRRLTLGSLADSRLGTVESALVGLARQDDLPGALAPAAWFDFLAGRAHRLEGVFRHNRDDVLSLVTLAAYLGRVEGEARANGEPLVGCAMRRARAIARAHLDAGNRAAALPWLERALERAPADGHDRAFVRETALLRAETLRLAGECAPARRALEAMVAPGEALDVNTLPALLALAKLLEHGSRDYRTALTVCEHARDVAARVGRVPPREATDLDRRIARLRRKVGAGDP